MRLSDEERERRVFSPERLERAVAEFEENGYLILEACLPRDLTGELWQRYADLLGAKMDRFNIRPRTMYDVRDATERDIYFFLPKGGNHDFNRWNMHLPSSAPFLDEEVVANPLGTAIIERILGEDCVLSLASSDTCMPNALYQVCHQDSAHALITVNIPLVDVDEDNGPTELWPRTHLPEPDRGRASFNHGPVPLRPAAALAYAERFASVLLTAPQGSLILRDQRALHRGTPNLSEEPRPMLSLIYDRAPAAVPPRALSEALARAALALRERGRGAGDGAIHERLLNFGNRLGSAVEGIARTDRDHRREIPAALWRGLSLRAQRLLRFARVEGRESPDYLALRGIGGAVPLLREAGHRAAEFLMAEARTLTRATRAPSRSRPCSKA